MTVGRIAALLGALVIGSWAWLAIDRADGPAFPMDARVASCRLIPEGVRSFRRVAQCVVLRPDGKKFIVIRNAPLAVGSEMRVWCITRRISRTVQCNLR